MKTVWCILHHTHKDTYHPARLIETEAVMGSPIRPATITLKLDISHNVGFPTVEEAQNVMLSGIDIPTNNIGFKPMEWDGDSFCVLIPDWEAMSVSIDEVLPHGESMEFAIGETEETNGSDMC